MTRMVGGTFGVAALGALVAAVGRHDLAQSLPNVPEARASGSSTRSAPARPSPARRATSAPPARRAFVDALGAGLTIAAIATALAAVVAWFMIDGSRPAQQAAPARRA